MQTIIQAKLQKDKRLVINYKPLNQYLIVNKSPIPLKDSLLARLKNALVFSKLDLKSGFWQFKIAKEDRYKTTFTLPHGHFEWNVMPMDLAWAPKKYQQRGEQVFGKYQHFIVVYIKDILIFSKTLSEHLIHLNQFVEICKSNNLVLSARKMVIATPKVKFLGVEICKG